MHIPSPILRAVASAKAFLSDDDTAIGLVTAYSRASAKGASIVRLVVLMCLITSVLGTIAELFPPDLATLRRFFLSGLVIISIAGASTLAGTGTRGQKILATAVVVLSWIGGIYFDAELRNGLKQLDRDEGAATVTYVVVLPGNGMSSIAPFQGRLPEYSLKLNSQLQR